MENLVKHFIFIFLCYRDLKSLIKRLTVDTVISHFPRTTFARNSQDAR